MRYIKAMAGVMLAVGAAGCSWRRTPVPIISESGSTALLVGSWTGEYSSAQTGRSGSISFDLDSEKDTAYCDVVMTPKVGNFRVATETPEKQAIVQPAFPEPLKMRFIRVGDGRVSGTLEPYTDPDCQCTVTTTFEGTFYDPNKIEGSYITQGSATYKTTSGKWKVIRKKTVASSR